MRQVAILHSHTEFSARDSLIKVDDYPRIAAEKGWSACAITDHGAIEGIPSFLKACAKTGIKPICGVELYVRCSDTYDPEKKKGNKLHHLTVVAKNAKGFSSLLRLISIGHRDHYIPKRQRAAIPIKLILEELEDCVIMSGCYNSPFWRGTDQAMTDLVDFMGRFKDDFYLEAQPLYDWSEQVVLNKMISEISRDLDLKVVVTPDCHFYNKSDGIFHNALLAVSHYNMFSTKLSYIATPNETMEGLGLAGFPGNDALRAIETTWEVAEKVQPWKWDDLPKPRLPVAPGNMKEVALRAFLEKGLAGRPGYKERLDQEIKVFSEAGLDQYLLLVRHCVNLFRAEGAELGPRGSVGGSLVAYLMGITPLDPIVHGLRYERFFAPGRCFPGHTPVVTRSGTKPISEIFPGTMVKTRVGWRRVKARSERSYDGYLVRIHFRTDSGSVVFESTPNHPLVKIDGIKEAGRVSVGEDGFIAVSHVRSGDDLGMVPVQSKEELLLERLQGQFQKKTAADSIRVPSRENSAVPHVRNGVYDKDVESGRLREQGMSSGQDPLSASGARVPLLRKSIQGAPQEEVLFTALWTVGARERLLEGEGWIQERPREIFPFRARGGLRQAPGVLWPRLPIRADQDLVAGRLDVHAGLPGNVLGDVYRAQGMERSRFEEDSDGQAGHEEAGAGVPGAVSGGVRPPSSVPSFERRAVSDRVRNGQSWTIFSFEDGAEDLCLVRGEFRRSDISPESVLREVLRQPGDVDLEGRLGSVPLLREKLPRFSDTVEEKGQILFQEVSSCDRLENASVERIEFVHYSGTVYNLSVDEAPEYFAWGILAHNCGWPDVDLDLDMATRERAPDILRKEFGAEKVAQISNYTTYKLRMAIKDAARAYGIQLADDSTFNEDEKDAKDIEDIPPGKELLKRSPDAAHFARMLVGRVRQFGAHAGGFVISADSLFGGRSAIVSRGKDKALCWDMEIADELGFIKMDFLGLDTLSAIKAIGQETGIDWAKVPLDNRAVYDDFSDGLTAGVPQFLSPGMRAFIRSLKPEKFKDLVWANAAFRPGGLGQMTPEQMAEKYHEDPDTIIVFQEDVMDICVRIAGFSWTEADAVRKIMAKSKGAEELEKWHPKFVEGCMTVSGWGKDNIEELWSALVGFGRYAFCMCVSGDTIVVRGGAGGNNPKADIFVKDLFEAQESNTPWGRKIRRGGIKLLAMDDDGRIRPRKLIRIYDNGVASVVRIDLANGASIRVTSNHRLLTEIGYVEAGRLGLSHRLVAIGEYEKREHQPTGNPQHRGHGQSYGPRCGLPNGPENPGWIDGRSALLERSKKQVLYRSGGHCEFCGTPNSVRFEFAHMKSLEDCGGSFEIYHSERNLKWACNPCHKSFDYAKGERKPRWSKGRPTKAVEIVGIHEDGKDHVFDIEMESPQHNFIANGIVSHNSHATSYSWNSYRVAYAKRHHSTAAFLALLKNEEKRQPIIDEAPKFGVKILPPDPNKSGLEWVIEGDSIRMPLQMADGMDLRLAKTVISKRANKPYVDAADLVSRMFNCKGESYKYPESMPSNLFSGKMPGYNFVLPAFSPRGLFTKKDLDEFSSKIRACMLCELGGFSRKIVPIEFGGSNVLVVGEAPGRDEIRRGRPFVGPSGKLVDEVLSKYGVSGKRLSWSNVCHCRMPFGPKGLPPPIPKNRTDELAVGCPWLEQELVMLKPPLVLAVGKKAWERLGGEDSITKANGTVVEIGGTKIVACIHPAFVLRDVNRRADFEMAIEKFCDLYRSLFPEEPRSDDRRLPEEVPVTARFRQLMGE